MANVNNSKPSDMVACPICGKMVRRRGLMAHIRLAHPDVDAKKVCASLIIPNTKDDTILRMTKNKEGELQLNWIANTPEEDVKVLRLLSAWHKQMSEKFENANPEAETFSLKSKDLIRAFSPRPKGEKRAEKRV